MLWIFWRWKIWHFWAKELMGMWYLLITEKVLVLIFSGMGNTVFFSARSWWKDDIYWLLKSSCLELLSDGKCDLFWVNKLMKRWYLLVTEKFLFWTFWWWEIRSFLQPKSWWKDDIYLVFLSFPWYSWAWEIWLFAKWLLYIRERKPLLYSNKVTRIDFVHQY